MEVEGYTQFTIKQSKPILEFMFELYKEVLTDDNFWHFFDEGEFGIYLRVPNEKVKAVFDFLSGKEGTVQADIYDEWSKIVTTLQDEMLAQFHINSVLAVKLYGMNLEFSGTKAAYLLGILDRSVHSFCNVTTELAGYYTSMANRSVGEHEAWESYILVEAAVNRAVYSGERKHYKRIMESRKDNENA